MDPLFRVYESVFGFDPYIGSTTVIPSDTTNETTPVSGTFGAVEGGKYYLEISTLEDNGFNTKGQEHLIQNNL